LAFHASDREHVDFENDECGKHVGLSSFDDSRESPGSCSLAALATRHRPDHQSRVAFSADPGAIVPSNTSGGILKISLSEYLLAARTGAWLLGLPILLRIRGLRRLLACLGHRAVGSTPGDLVDPHRVAQIVTRVCRLPIFDLPPFPRICLRRSLALYHVLGRMGHDASIHIGVRKEDASALEGHSWVTIDGETLGERDPVESFRAIYSYPTASHSA